MTKDEILAKQNELKKAMDDAQAQLDALEKSEKGEGVDPISELEKALADFEEAEKLEKAKADEEAEALKKAEDEGIEEDEKEDEKEEGVVKSLPGLSELLGEDLVKASEEYAALRKSVEGTQSATNAKLDALAGLTVGISKAVVGLSKALAEFGKEPFQKSLAHLGIDGKDAHDKAQSNSEVRERLIKALNDGEIEELPPGLLQRVDKYGAIAVPDLFREKLGITLPSA